MSVGASKMVGPVMSCQMYIRGGDFICCCCDCAVGFELLIVEIVVSRWH